jgi:hypothetical protein
MKPPIAPPIIAPILGSDFGGGGGGGGMVALVSGVVVGVGSIDVISPWVSVVVKNSAWS